MLEKYADLNERDRIHNRHNLSGRCITKDTSVGPLSPGERAGVGKDRVHPLHLRPGTWFTGINHGQEVLTMPWNQESPMDQRV
ncbi:hypothetical protein, partial [Pseudomonas fluorescens]|uniref:hypothetical protein n=1 Tax=Pseudomonas fluorescens TaxID=294 RepID=UPI001CD2BF9C